MATLFFSLLIAALCCQLAVSRTRCQQDPLCRYNERLMTITCNTAFGSNNASVVVPDLSCFPPVNTYLFMNFERIQPQAFSNLSFTATQTLTLKLINVSTIDPGTFSNSIDLSNGAKLVIEIEDSANIVIEPNAFGGITIDRLHFLHLDQFNGSAIFNTSCFGDGLHINELIFDHCGITAFSNLARPVVRVDSLLIRNSPAWTQLSAGSLPSFLGTSASLEIAKTGLQTIHPHTFHAWSLILKKLTISDNFNLETFPSEIVDGVLMKLEKLNLSNNSIKTLPVRYNWFPYSNTKQLTLRKQQLDLFLQSNILKKLPLLEKIDLSEGYIAATNNSLIKNYFPNMTNLTSIDVSQTNLTETMIIDLLTRISETTTRFVDIHLGGHLLTDANFCAYFTIYKNAPGLLNLFLDSSHPCNCVIDLFYRDNLRESPSDDLVPRPTCLLDSSRQRCDIEVQLSTAQCALNRPNPTPSDDDKNIGDYAFGGVVAGVVLVLLSIGFGLAYRVRRRRGSILTMDQPVEDPSLATVEERLSNA